MEEVATVSFFYIAMNSVLTQHIVTNRNYKITVITTPTFVSFDDTHSLLHINIIKHEAICDGDAHCQTTPTQSHLPWSRVVLSILEFPHDEALQLMTSHIWRRHIHGTLKQCVLSTNCPN